MTQQNKFVVLISGNGSNLEAMCKAGLSNKIAAVISNKADAKGLDIAAKYQIPIKVIEHTNFIDRDSFDEELIKTIENYSPFLVVLAGFMRILTNKFVNFYNNRLLNIHPSILPAFIGIKAIEQALTAKVKLTGVTVHIVTPQLDAGPILAQGVVEINPHDTLESLTQRIRKLEHTLYPFVINKFLNNKMRFLNNNAASIIHEDDDNKLLNELTTSIYY